MSKQRMNDLEWEASFWNGLRTAAQKRIDKAHDDIKFYEKSRREALDQLDRIDREMREEVSE